MLKLLSWISLFVLLAVVFGADHENRVWKSKVVSPNATHEFVGNSTTNGAQCYDRRLSSFIDTGLQYYSHDMGKLAQYILDQVASNILFLISEFYRFAELEWGTIGWFPRI